MVPRVTYEELREIAKRMSEAHAWPRLEVLRPAPLLPAPTSPREDQFGDPVDYFIRTGAPAQPKPHTCKTPVNGWFHQKFGDGAIWCCSTCGQLWTFEGWCVDALAGSGRWREVTEEWVQEAYAMPRDNLWP